jgi:hypothetical protein
MQSGFRHPRAWLVPSTDLELPKIDSNLLPCMDSERTSAVRRREYLESEGGSVFAQPEFGAFPLLAVAFMEDMTSARNSGRRALKNSASPLCRLPSC